MTNDLQTQLSFARIDDKTRALLRAAWPVVDKGMTRILDDMYAHILQRPDLKALFANEDRIQAARQRQREHWRQLFSGTFDEAYIASVSRIATTHARIGLQPSFYISTYLIALEQVHTLLIETDRHRMLSRSTRAGLAASMRAVDRAVLFDLQLVVTSYLEEGAIDYRRRLHELAEQFDAVLGGFTQDIGNAAHTLHDSSAALLDAAGSATQEAAALARGAEESSLNMQAVAAAAEEISASIGEITRQTRGAAEVTGEAVTTVQRAGSIVETLNATAQRIGGVVSLIQDIAGQTNLLALNATIEAARAGDAGKGFAVVASEVKTLSAQTARATDDIRVQMNAVQKVVSQIASAMAEITQAVDRIRETTDSIAGAVDQQGEATQEISRSVAAAANSAAGITDGVRKVEQVATHNADNARGLATSASELQGRTNALTDQTSALLDRIRMADRRSDTRVQMNIKAELMVNGTTFGAMLQNVSAGGAGLRMDTSRLPPARHDVSLRIPGAPLQPGSRIVNADGSLVNLAFLSSAEGESLMRWIQANQKTLQARAA